MVMTAIASPETIDQPPVQRADLANWDYRIYQFEYEAAVEAGFSVGSVKVKGGYKLLVIDAARSRDVVNGEKRETWGYGYRLLVEVNNTDSMGSLTLPAIAASVQLRTAEAQVWLQVNGWVGDELWGELPAPKPLDVDSYRAFLEVASRIQKSFATHPDKAIPVKLAKGEAQSLAADGVTRAEAREAVAAVMMLNLAREGASIDEMVNAVVAHSDLDEGAVSRLAQALFLSLEDGDPSGDRRKELASSLLEPLRQGGWHLP